MEQQHINKLNSDITTLFRQALSLSLRHIHLLPHFTKAFFHQRSALKRREMHLKAGTHVPPFMIISVTNKCNLKCSGCYSHAQNTIGSKEMSPEKLDGLLKEARELGISMVLVSGGEPLLVPGLLETLKRFPEIIFILFTNGTQFTSSVLAELKKSKHIMPVLSIEGLKSHTDLRRGSGIFDTVKDSMAVLKQLGILYGLSFTVTTENFNFVFNEQLVKESIAGGCGLFFFVEYVPADQKSEHLVISEGQRKVLIAEFERLRSTNNALFFSFPSGEEDYGGCLAAGRGFIHVNPAGSIEPCPFAQLSDTDLSKATLKEALNSKFLKAIRDNHGMLKETAGGCALYTNREFVRSLLKNVETQ